MLNGKPLLRCRTFHQVKKGAAAAEYEDAFACMPRRGRFAMADGASESSFAASWAQLLVRGAASQSGPWARWLGRARDRWQSGFVQVELPWFAEAKAEQGAHATLLSLVFHTDKTNKLLWKAVAVGDTCLFVVRGDRLRRAFPFTRSESFGTTPTLLCSRRAVGRRVRIKRRVLRGTWKKGDRYLLMTDALAQWFLTEHENRRKPWRILSRFRKHDDFSAWLTEARAARAIRNDDVSLVVVHAAPMKRS